MNRKYIITADDSIEGFNKEIAKLEREWAAEEIEPSEDAVSREEVQDLISIWLSDYLLDETREALETINYKVGDMPAVYPERPKGKWMRKTKVDGVYDIAGVKTWGVKCQCDRCDFTTIVIEDFGYYKYCPNCGAEMIGGIEDENNPGC